MKFGEQMKFIALAIGIAATISSAAFAGFNQGDNVTLSGQPVLRIASGAEGFSPEKRAWQAQDALDNALFLTSSPGPSSVAVCRKNGAYTLQLGGHYIATADENSARAEGLSPLQLADSWATSLRTALSDPNRVENYIATLKVPHQLQGEAVAFERKVYAPRGTALPVVFTQDLRSSQLVADQLVSAKVTEDVPLGNYVIPADSLLIGNAVENRPGVFELRMTSLHTPSGTEMPIDAVLTSCSTGYSVAPHPVATLAIPANSTTDTRIPALIGIGTGCSKPTMTALLLNKDNGDMIAIGQPATVVIQQVSPVAVVPGAGAM